MILVGNQRGGGKNLALHLLKEENDHVQVHEVRGFASTNLMGALNEAYALSRATKCRQYLFSLSLNPPPQENVATDDFESAIERVEGKLGLRGQPRAIVFHEKEGRRHCHAVWSRIDHENMKAIPLPFTKRKMQEIARDLFREHGWEMSRGLRDSCERDPRNFTLAEWQHAKRFGNDPRAIKASIQDAWAESDCSVSFGHALNAKGYWLARGDRRGFVAIDVHGEVYSLARQAGVKAKVLRERLGNPDSLPSVTEAKARMASEMLPKLKSYQQELSAQAIKRKEESERMRVVLTARQKQERDALNTKIEQRRVLEIQHRQARFRKGLGGVWDHLRGESKRIRKGNECEALQSMLRDRAEKDAIIFKHLEQRQRFSLKIRIERAKITEQKQGIRRERENFQEMKTPQQDYAEKRRAYVEQCKQQRPARKRGPTRER